MGTGFEGMSVCTLEIAAICKSQNAISESINCVEVLHLFNQSLAVEHIFFLLSKAS